MSRKYNQDSATKYFAQAGLILIDTYKSFDDKMTCVDTDGYKYMYSLHYITKVLKSNINISHRYNKNNPYYWDNIQTFMRTKTLNHTELLTDKADYTNAKQKLTFLCGSCGKTYRQSFETFVRRNNHVCPECAKALGYAKTRTKRTVYDDKARMLGLNILTTGDFVERDKITVIDKDGYKGYINAKDLLYNNTSIVRYGKSNPYTMYNIHNFINLHCPDCKVQNKQYIGTNTTFDFVCKCGKTFKRTWNKFCYNADFYCDICKSDISTIETMVKIWLDKNQISFEREKSFDGCNGDHKPLRFDFFLTDYNACIEVDGIQHYKPVGYSVALTKDDAQRLFEQRQRYDKIKETFCANHNIPMLRIGFWEFNINNPTYLSTLHNFILSLQK